MKIKGQHISSLFTLLAGLIIFTHAVVPHHHHFEITHSPEEASACETPVQGGNHEKPDIHCHALNILVSKRTISNTINQSLSDHFNLFPSGSISQIEIPPLLSITSRIVGNPATLINQLFFTAHTFRGPPAIS